MKKTSSTRKQKSATFILAEQVGFGHSSDEDLEEANDLMAPLKRLNVA